MSTTISGNEAFLKAGDSQPCSSTLNSRQRGQRDIGGVASIPEPAFIDMALVRMCKDELDAVNLCIDLSRLADSVLSERLGIDPGHFSRIRKGRAHFPTVKRLALMFLAGNFVPLQYEAFRARFIERMQEQFVTQPRFG